MARELEFTQRYFYEQEDYPHFHEMEELLPFGYMFWYVGSQFLNGLVNLTGEPVVAYVAGRYTALDEECRRKVQYCDPPRSFKWKTMESPTKQQVYDLMTQPGRDCHSRLDSFADDILMLTKSPLYWTFYWFDCDVSDCGIGRFKTDDPDEEVIQHFRDWVLSNKVIAEYHAPLELPKTFFSGWITF